MQQASTKTYVVFRQLNKMKTQNDGIPITKLILNTNS